MDAETFYDRYGQYIANAQNDKTLRISSEWPYLNLRLPDADIAVQDPGIKQKFIPNGTDYGGHIAGVMYIEGKIAYVPLPYKQYPAISFQFSGCYMAKLCFKGKWYAFHISTSRETGKDCKEDWNNFLSIHKSDISEIVMCKPTDRQELFDKYGELHFTHGESNITLACLIDESNHCHTLVYDWDSARVYQDESCCCGWFRSNYIQPCPPNLLCRTEDLAYFSSIQNK
ncbi:MAG: hypothetical protein NC396_04340 [Bacteroides sp.]|nr:hypothetical protein [Bacteroides sp.]MCM1085588.1 hypothetical protein [Bacteroides sp.]